MFLGTLTEREVETLMVAIRFWRHHRLDARRTDNLLTREETDLLLAKLGTGILSSLPDDESELPADIF